AGRRGSFTLGVGGRSRWASGVVHAGRRGSSTLGVGGAWVVVVHAPSLFQLFWDAKHPLLENQG
ncbi:MAG: hypothetical protein ABIQ16_15820, partial [Polyangiaceae bacterium]